MPNVKRLTKVLAKWQAAEKALRKGEKIEVDGHILVPDQKPGQFDLDLDTAVKMVARLKAKIELGKKLEAIRPDEDKPARTSAGVPISPAAAAKIFELELTSDEVDGIKPNGKGIKGLELSVRDINLFLRKKAEKDKVGEKEPEPEKSDEGDAEDGGDVNPLAKPDAEEGAGEAERENEGEGEEDEPETWTRGELVALTFDELREAGKVHGIVGRSRHDLTASLEDKQKKV